MRCATLWRSCLVSCLLALTGENDVVARAEKRNPVRHRRRDVHVDKNLRVTRVGQSFRTDVIICASNRALVVVVTVTLSTLACLTSPYDRVLCSAQTDRVMWVQGKEARSSSATYCCPVFLEQTAKYIDEHNRGAQVIFVPTHQRFHRLQRKK